MTRRGARSRLGPGRPARRAMGVVMGILQRLSLALVAVPLIAATARAGKSDLRVLYVGPDPDVEPVVPSYYEDPARVAALTRERLPAFRAFLEEHFTSVRVVVVDDYVPAMSDAVDVTVFDARPPVLETRQVDDMARKIRLPDDFTAPALFVGEVAPFTLGRFGAGLKLDHL